MLKLFQRKPQVVLRTAPDGVRLYAFGDIHGRLDLLGPLLTAVAEDAAEAREAVAIFLGDYIDRGPDSAGVIDELLGFARASGLQCRFLRGNHDHTLLRFLEDAGVGPTWCSFGGGETLASYGVTAPTPRAPAASWESTRDAFAAVLPARHLSFFNALEAYVTYGDYFFSHAGARPGATLEDQTDHDLMWIRDDFLRSSTVWPKAVVHGHTPEEAVYADHRRIGVDTGAYATGKLTAVVLDGADRAMFQTQASRGQIAVERLPIAG